MNMIEKIGDIEGPIGELETTVEALRGFVDNMKHGNNIIYTLDFMANHLGDISQRLRNEFNKAVDQDSAGPKLVS